jgi:molybdopterin converting factor subunit 1
VHGHEPGSAPPPPPSTSQPAAAPAPVVSVLYFAVLRELAHTSEERLTLDSSPLRVDELLRALEARHSELRGRLESVRVAVNEEFVDRASLLSGGEVVALIPPVSGG